MSATPSSTHELSCPACERRFPAGTFCPDDGAALVRVPTGDDDSLVGTTLDGRFTVLERIAEGGMGAVYRALQRSIAREVAVKVVRSEYAGNAGIATRFLREAKIASGLSHPNVVSVLEFGQTPEGLLYLVMELLRGRNLDEELDAVGPLAPARAVWIGAQLCDALAAAHARGIVHRDLKPANVFLLAEPPGRDLLKVVDFGIAKAVSVDDKATSTGVIVGTLAYMAPEVRMGDAASVASDLYSLGVVMFEVLGGKVRGATPLGPEDVASGLESSEAPAELVAVIARLVHPIASERPRDAAEVRAALQASLSGTGSASASASRSKATRMVVAEPRRRRGRGMVIGSAVAVVVGAVGLWLVMRPGDDRSPSPSPSPSTSTSTTTSTSPSPSTSTSPSPSTEVAIELHATPKAQVWIDGKRIGETPLTHRVPSGTTPLAIELRRAGYRTERQKVVPDRPARISVELHRARSKEPAGGEGFILPGGGH